MVAAALGAAALATAVQGAVSAAPPSAPTTASAVTVVPAERSSLCRLTPASIRQLLAGAPGPDEAERLRDAVWLLEDNLNQWRGGAEGLPQAAPAVRLAADVESAWREALRQHDAGDAARRRAALGRADAALGELDPTPRAGAAPGCS